MTQNVKVNNEGFTLVSEPDEAVLDVVILHGLNGHPFKTFHYKSTEFYWPFELAKQLTRARILVYGYSSKIDSGYSNAQGVLQYGEGLHTELENLRSDQLDRDSRPLILIGHSLGGLVIKQLLVHSSYQSDRWVLSSTKAIFFLGTPHRGSGILEKHLARMGVKLSHLGPRRIPEKVMPALQPGTNESMALNRAFMRIQGPILVVNFVEQRAARLNQIIVDQTSADFDTPTAETIPVDRDHINIVKFAGPDDNAYKLLYKTLQRKIKAILEVMENDLSENTAPKISNECLESLEAPQRYRRQRPPRAQYKASLERLWTEKAEFQEWLDDGPAIYHVTGKPGSGKSFLMRGLVSRLTSHCNETAIVASHFLNNRGEASEYTFHGLLRSVLYQILRREPKLFYFMTEEWREAQRQARDQPEWDTNLLQDALFRIITHGSRNHRFYLILDGLDECEDFGGADCVVSFMTEIMEGCKSDNLRLLFSCREVPETIIAMQASRGIRMEHENWEDIEKLIDERWNKLRLPGSKMEEYRKLKVYLIKKADGIFLWARLALDRLCTAIEEGDAINEIWQHLEEIPSQLSEMFKMFLARLDRKQSEESYKMLGIVLAAGRPLTLSEVRFIMGFRHKAFSSLFELERSRDIVTDNDVMARRIRSRCGGLLEIKRTGGSWHPDGKHLTETSTHLVQFLHQSVKDFLLGLESTTESGLPDKDRLLGEGHALLSQGCLWYLRTTEVASLSSEWARNASRATLSREFPLLEYAVHSWRDHYAEASRLGMQPIDLMEHFYGPLASSFDHWKQLYNSLNLGKAYIGDYTLCHFAVEKNLASLVNELCASKRLDTRACDQSTGSYLCSAVQRGSIEAVRVLLDHGASPDDGGYDVGRPVMIACSEGHSDILRMLLEANAELHEGPGYWRIQSLPVISELWSPLAMAALSGKEDMIRLILRYDPSAIKNPYLREYAVLCLVVGARIGAEEMPKTEREEHILSKVSKLLPLLCPGSERYNGIFSDILMPILCAAQRYSESSLKMFLGTQLASSHQFLSQMFSDVCKNGPLRSVQFLTQKCGTDRTLQMTIEHNGSLLHSAVQNQDTSVLIYLLSIGLDINAQNSEGYTPLHTAALYASEEHMSLLLAKGADGTRRTRLRYTAFHIALSNPDLPFSRVVLSHLLEAAGGKVDLPLRDGVQPIHLAALTGFLPVLEWLIQKGASLEARDDYKRTPLHSTAASLNEDGLKVIDYLVNQGLDVSGTDIVGKTPLHHIFEARDELDLEIGCDSDLHLRKAQRLVRHGADVVAKDANGNTPLHISASKHELELVKFLLKSGADSSTKNRRKQKAIDVTGDEGIRELLASGV